MAKGYILMLERDEHDRELSQSYFESMNVAAQFVQQSQQVMIVLEKAIQENVELPALILLSMNSVPDNGLEVLCELKKEKRFRHIPVVILGENAPASLVRSCHAEGASTFINKPLSNALTDLSIKTFLKYWFEVAELAPIRAVQAVN